MNIWKWELCISGRLLLLNFDINVRLSRSLEGCLLIKCHILANLNLPLTGNIYTISLRGLTVTDKCALLPGGLHLHPSFLWYMNVHWKTKYPQVSNS